MKIESNIDLHKRTSCRIFQSTIQYSFEKRNEISLHIWVEKEVSGSFKGGGGGAALLVNW